MGRLHGGKPCGIVDGEGNAEYLTAVIRELLRSTEFVDGLTGEGWQLWIDQLTGLTNLTVDKVTPAKPGGAGTADRKVRSV